jgi:hypothetical protein
LTSFFLSRMGLSVCLLTAATGYAIHIFVEDRFSLANISYENSVPFPEPSLDSQEEIPKELHSIFQQKFTYLGKGHQTYAFVSEDNNYVLKFFKFTYLKPSKMLNLFSSLPQIDKYKVKDEKLKQQKLERLFKGYQIAFEKDKDNSGLIYIHLAKTQHLKTLVSLKDQLGFQHLIPLDPFVFVIQKKVKMTKHELGDLLARQDIEGFKKRMDQLIKLYIDEYQRGLYDSDHNIMSNTGFLHQQAIRLDVGRLTYTKEIEDPAIYVQNLRNIFANRINKWLKNNYPQYAQELIEYTEAKISASSGN